MSSARLLDLANCPFRAPLHAYQQAGQLTVGLSMGGFAVPAAFLKKGGPRLVILSDDHFAAGGPTIWPQAKRLLKWANALVLHGAAGRAADYERIAQLAVVHRQLLLAEIRFEHMQAWMELAAPEMPRLHILQIVPEGGQHPLPPAPNETVH